MLLLKRNSWLAPTRQSTVPRSSLLRVHYQPVVDLASGQVTSVEALARVQRDGRLLPPAAFLPGMDLDERMMLFHDVLAAATQQLVTWNAQGLRLSVSLNLDAQILLREGIVARLQQSLDETGLAPETICLELLETHDLPDVSLACRRIEAIRALGIRVALDDFGAGYSSILKIRELPLDAVKLDRAFTAGLREHPDDLLFVAVCQTLTTARGMTLIVEGVETADVLDALNVMGVRYAQGYLFARPMPAEALKPWLAGQDFAQTPEPKTPLGAYAMRMRAAPGNARLIADRRPRT